MFYAKPGEGFTVAEGVTPPKITYMQLSLYRMAGAGTQASPLQITSAAQLAEIAELVNDGMLEQMVFGGDSPVYLKLMKDITLTGEWTPIGHDNSNKFKGYFDGNDKTISGLKITVGTYEATGLFGFVESGSVKNLGLAGVDITGNEDVGGVAGFVGIGGKVENCSVTGKVVGISYVGGVAGSVDDGGSVTNCYNKAAVSGSGYNIGGVAGLVYGSVASCYSTGAVSSSGNSDYIGGVAGRVDHGGGVENCYSTGAVNGSNAVGGVAGIVNGSVTSCYSTGAVSGNNNVGGVAGNVYDGSVENCAALNPSVEAASNSGRVAGYSSNNPTLANNVAFVGILNNSGTTFSGANTLDGLNGENIAATDVKDDIGGRFPWEYWQSHETRLPTLWGLDGQDQLMPAHLGTGISYFGGGDGSSGNPYLIKTEAQLRSLADLVNAGKDNYAAKYYKLTANITLNGEWTPIGMDFGTAISPFYGSFDGDNQTIRGLTINNPGGSYQGLFGNVVGGTINNVRLVDCDITGGYNVGGIAGYIYGGYSGGGAEVVNCSVSGKVAGTAAVGGIVGNADNSVNIKESFTACNITATSGIAGGIAGALSASFVTDCYTTGDVASSSGNAGGIAGTLTGGSQVMRCYSTGSIYGEIYVGGIAGSSSGTITGCAALNPSVESTGSTGSAGRVLGHNGGSNNLSDNVAFDGMTDGSGSAAAWGNRDADKIDGADKTVYDLQAITGFPDGFDEDAWEYEEKMLPGLGAPVNMPFHLKTDGYFADGTGTPTNPYQIETAAQLKNLARLVNAEISPYADAGKHYKLMDDLTLTGEWMPIGLYDNCPFQGHFDGGYHTIYGLKVSSYGIAGLLGWVKGGSVKNLGLAGVDVSGTAISGGVAGYVDGGSVENCYVTGAVSGNAGTGTSSTVGGMAGNVDGGSVKNCYSTAAVSGDRAGGVAGNVRDGGSVENCCSTGAVSNTGTVFGGVGYTGGVAGYVDDNGSVTNCAALNPGVKDTGTNAPVGRVVGYKDATGTLSDNYAFKDMRASVWSNIGAGDLDGADMTKIQAVTPTFWTGTMVWDESVWTLEQGKLPILTGFLDQDGEPGLYLTGLPSNELTINPETANADVGGSITFTVTGMKDWTYPQIDWRCDVSGLTPSTTENGKAALTVPAGAAGQTITVTAINTNSGKTAEATVTVADTTVPVTGVSVYPASVSMNPGNTHQLTATVSPADATIRDVSWSSSDYAVAAVDGSGKVTAVAAGSAVITATTVDGGFTADCAVTVTSGTGGYTPDGYAPGGYAPGGSSGGSGGSGGSSGANYTVSPQSGITWLERNPASILADNAKRDGKDYVRTSNTGAYGVRKAALLVLAGLRYSHDTAADGAVQVRVSIPEPGKAASDLLVSGYVKGGEVDRIRGYFEKWFKNKVRVLHMDQAEPWGQPVEIAAKVDLTGMDTSNLCFYSYDKATNTYRRIEKPAYWLDKNGYLRFTTELAGDIVVSEGPLERK